MGDRPVLRSDLVECPLCPWRIDPDTDSDWADALAAHQAHHAELEEASMTTCKIDGCENESAGRRGSWTGLCAEHVSAEAKRRQAVSARQSAPLVAESRPDGNGHTNLSLVELAQAVEQAHDAYRAALDRLVEAATKG